MDALSLIGFLSPNLSSLALEGIPRKLASDFGQDAARLELLRIFWASR